MSTKETVDFEGLAPVGGIYSPLVDYDGFHWSNIGVADRAWVHHNVTLPNGYDSIIHGHGVGYTFLLSAHARTDSTISADTPFTLKSGLFATVSGTADVTFKAFSGGIFVGKQVVTLNNAGSDVTFNDHFKHIDTVEIITKVDSHAALALENLKVVLDVSAAPADTSGTIARAGEMLAAHDLVQHPVETLGGHGFDALC